MATQSISSLNLSSKAEKAAKQLPQEHPDVRFTSGRRDLKEQAHAMAANVAKASKMLKHEAHKAHEGKITALIGWRFGLMASGIFGHGKTASFALGCMRSLGGVILTTLALRTP
jgi:hypothetical protein